MGRKTVTVNDRARQMLAQEAARIIVEQGIQDFRLAKTKAAERLGLKDRARCQATARSSRPSANTFPCSAGNRTPTCCTPLRRIALAAMEVLSPFDPRLVGPVLHGTAAPSSSINLHVFSDTPELIALKP